jgi:ABC-2 type transport system ATP-binding protein
MITHEPLGSSPAGSPAGGDVDRNAATAVQVHQLRKTYPNGVEAVQGLTFEVAEGEIFGLLGPNGAGKSTTLGVLTTMLRSWTGSVRIAGHDVRLEPLQVRAAIGVVFQDTVLDNEFSGLENLRLHARLWGLGPAAARQRIRELLGVMDLEDRADDNVRAYSGGMRRRLEIARALLARPRVLFLDEPTTGLDPAIRSEIWHLITRLRHDEGVTIVLSTHYLEEAEDVCDRVGIMHRGRLVRHGVPRQLVDDLGPDLLELRSTGDTEGLGRGLAEAGIGRRDPMVRGDRVITPIGDGGDRWDEVVRQVSALSSNGAGVVASTVRRATLADVFAYLTSDENTREAS